MDNIINKLRKESTGSFDSPDQESGYAQALEDIEVELKGNSVLLLVNIEKEIIQELEANGNNDAKPIIREIFEKYYLQNGVETDKETPGVLLIGEYFTTDINSETPTIEPKDIQFFIENQDGV